MIYKVELALLMRINQFAHIAVIKDEDDQYLARNRSQGRSPWMPHYPYHDLHGERIHSTTSTDRSAAYMR